MLFLLGGADDYAPPGPCRAYAEWFRASGAKVEVVEYPGAPHGFDFPGRPVRLDKAMTLNEACGGELDVATRAYRLDTPEKALRTWRPIGPNAQHSGRIGAGQVEEFLFRCRTLGATVGGDAAASAAVRPAVAGWLRSIGFLR